MLPIAKLSCTFQELHTLHNRLAWAVIENTTKRGTPEDRGCGLSIYYRYVYQYHGSSGLTHINVHDRRSNHVKQENDRPSTATITVKQGRVFRTFPLSKH